MSALAAIMKPGSPPALLTRAIQLTAMLAFDMAAAAEFAARGGVIGLLALVSDSKDKEVKDIIHHVPSFLSNVSCVRDCLQLSCAHSFGTALSTADRAPPKHIGLTVLWILQGVAHALPSVVRAYSLLDLCTSAFQFVSNVGRVNLLLLCAGVCGGAGGCGTGVPGAVRPGALGCLGGRGRLHASAGAAGCITPGFVWYESP